MSQDTDGLHDKYRVSFEVADEIGLVPGKVELGQGIRTALAQIAADALGVAPSQIRLAVPQTGIAPDEGITSGSRSVATSGAELRAICCRYREALLRQAARELRCDPEALRLRDGRIEYQGQLTSCSYWSLANPQWQQEALQHPPMLSLTGTGVIGQSLPRVDIPAKIRGEPVYIQDLEMPGMRWARVLRAPGHRATLSGERLAALGKMPGVEAVVQDGDFLGVIATREDQAVRAQERAKGWLQQVVEPLPCNDGAAHEYMVQQKAETSRVEPKLASAAQPAQDAIDVPETTRHQADAAQTLTVSARYTKPFIAHASIGPSCAVALWQNDRLEVWSHSQSPYPLRAEMARVLGLSPEAIVIRHVEGAGCYGHNGADDAALDAALLARAMPGVPIHLQWMREDEFAWEPYGTAMCVDLKASVTAAGEIKAWRLDTRGHGHVSRPGPAEGRVSSLIGAWHLAQPFERRYAQDPVMGPDGVSHGGTGRNAWARYRFPVQEVYAHRVPTDIVRVSSLRGIGAYANVFAIESFMDEVADAVGLDALTLRLQHLEDPRAIAVLQRVAAMADWSHRARATNTDDTEALSLGIAYAQYGNAMGHCAVVAEIGVDPDVRVKRVMVAADVGVVINPDGVRNQIEGGVIQAISWTLKERARFGPEGRETLSWADYPILGFTELPAIAVELIDRPDEAPLGAGEITMGPTAAAIANALSRALGVRIRDLPLNRENIERAVLAGN